MRTRREHHPTSKHALLLTGGAFLALSLLALSRKGNSIYADRPEEQNPFEGKHVVFAEDADEPENADGLRGHLEEVGAAEPYHSFYQDVIKRGLDIGASFAGIVLLAPLMGAIALVIKAEDSGPILFTQKRVGQNKRFFRMHKFRTMKMSAPHDTPTHMLQDPDQHLTRTGRFLREFSLDELPQIWDVFLGNMSVAGPRPALWNQDVLVAERDRYGANAVRPGLTGWAQINGRDELSISEKAAYDGEYTDRVKKGGLKALLFDLRCVALTGIYVICRKWGKEK